MKYLKLKTNQYQRKIRTYKEFRKDYYQYRVDEILEYVTCNDNEYLEQKKESDILYATLKSMLNEEGQILLREFSDANNYIRILEEYALAKQIYKDLEK